MLSCLLAPAGTQAIINKDTLLCLLVPVLLVMLELITNEDY
jgi:hypothetical protein